MGGSYYDAENSVAADGSHHTMEPPELESTANSQQQPQMIIKSKRDEALVNGARVVVILVWFIAALLISSFGYVQLSHNEEKTFKAQFLSNANQVVYMSKKNAANVFVSFESLASLFPLYAQATNATLPYVTIQDFEAMAQGARTISKAAAISYSPLLYTEEDLKTWAAYSAQNDFWIENGRQYIPASTTTAPPNAANAPATTAGPPTQNNSTSPVVEPMYMPFVFTFDPTTRQPIPASGYGPFAPVWQMSPVPGFTKMINTNMASMELIAEGIAYITETGRQSLSRAMSARDNFGLKVDGAVSTLLQPVFDGFTYSQNRTVVGYISALLAWKHFFDDILPVGQEGIDIVVQSCETSNTFRINGARAEFLGADDLHDRRYDPIGVSADFINFDHTNELNSATAAGQECRHIVNIYPTKILEASYNTNRPIVYSVIIFSIFFFAAIVFLTYDWFVMYRQSRTEMRAEKSTAIVQELFPGDVAKQLFKSETTPKSKRRASLAFGPNAAPSHQGGSINKFANDKTIAQLYPDATVLFADIAGFTAWSSTRDPNQVFTLLESVFQAFDAIANRYRIFKVETIGDCYVAVCGVPDARKEHAVVMCGFARNAMSKFRSVCRTLELKLGPDTADLALRVGMHSGPVTAGVLRGERARFQLFGDTVNTASRIESTGQRDRIHLSEQTANELIKCGKEHWLMPRSDTVEAKGKGKLLTYWLKPTISNKSQSGGTSPHVSIRSDTDEDSDSSECEGTNPQPLISDANFAPPEVKPIDHDATTNGKYYRLIHWNCELLTELLQRVMARRASKLPTPAATADSTQPRNKVLQLARQMSRAILDVNSTDENTEKQNCVVATQSSDLNPEVLKQLRSYVGKIASMYHDNPFHNFEHASHVAMSVNRLLSRIDAPDATDVSDGATHPHVQECRSILSDPVTQFGAVLAALIHDMDHTGVPNGQLIQEDPALADRYNHRNVAERNSVDLAWDLLTSSAYDDLRVTIFDNETEQFQFKDLLFNAVIATDIFDAEQVAQRKKRWDAAFNNNDDTTSSELSPTTPQDTATVIIEHLIQASDVAHTMQHWHVYCKWNQRLFHEMNMAFRNGRSSNHRDPAEGWYEGEIHFFDKYVIPLAQKLKDCSVFGVTGGDEYLNYALQNRCEWELKGRDIVQSIYANDDDDVVVPRATTDESSTTTHHSSGYQIREV